MSKQSASNNSYNGIEVVVLGASGFIGRWVARALYARGARLHLVVRNKNIAGHVFAQSMVEGNIIEADVRDAAFIRSLFRKIRPAVTFNLAGYGVDRSERDESMAYEINAQLVKNVCEAIARDRDPEWQGREIVHVGSALEYGDIGGNLAEDSVPCPTTLYGQTKLAGTRFLEECCKEIGIKGLTARLFSVYGPGEHSSRLLPSLIDAVHTGKAIPLTTGNQKRDFTYVEDVAEGLLRLGLVAATSPDKIVNLATGTLTSVRCFAESAARILKIPQNHLVFGAIPTRKEEMEHDVVSLRLLLGLAKWVPSTSVEVGIRKTLKWRNQLPSTPDHSVCKQSSEV
jgi:nucleoside-diphosphate-sugar epimerase